MQESYRLAIRDMLEIWNLEHREAQHSQESLDVLSYKFAQDLIEERVTPKELAGACRLASRRWRFFPKMSDILTAVDDYRAKPPAAAEPPNILLSSETSRHDLTPEELTRNRDRVKVIAQALAGRMSFDDAERQVAEMGNIGEFSTMAGKREYRA